MAIWNLLKDHVEMSLEMKLEQLYNMIVSSENRDRKEPYTDQFRELLSSLPVGSVTPISKGDPPATRTLLQARYIFNTLIITRGILTLIMSIFIAHWDWEISP